MTPADGGKNEHSSRRHSAFFQYYMLGFQFCVTVIAGVLAGWWMEQRHNTRGLWVMAGVALGLVVAFYTLLRDIRR